MTGQTISHYRILSVLGEGGMGKVYQAEDIHLERPVAIKFLHTNEETLRLLREAKTAAALSHPNICAIYEVDPERGFLAMELVEGRTLKDILGKRPLPAREAVRLAMQMGEGLAAAHAKGTLSDTGPEEAGAAGGRAGVAVACGGKALDGREDAVFVPWRRAPAKVFQKRRRSDASPVPEAARVMQLVPRYEF